MFTGVDVIVILLVLGVLFYATNPSTGGSEFKVEPLTLLVMIIVVGMIVLSFI